MSAADATAVQAHESDLAEAARIYGYKFEAGVWHYEQTLCTPIRETILLHYFQFYPDGTQSLFTALVPLGEGRVRIVPVLYHNIVPYLPAPKNPRNYALFNELVSRESASRDWLQLSACYAELTGGFAIVSPGPNADIGIALAPTATVRLNQHTKSASVSFGERDGEHSYKVWNISFKSDGRVSAAATEERSVIAARSTLPSEPSSVTAPAAAAEISITAGAPSVSQPSVAVSPSEQSAPRSAARPASTVRSASASAPTVLPAKPTPSSTEPEPGVASGEASEPGWKYIRDPAGPPSKIIPDAPPPPEKSRPNPPDGSGQSDTADQPQQ